VRGLDPQRHLMQTSLVGGSNVFPFPKIVWDHQPVVATLGKNEAGLRHPRIFFGNKPNLSLCFFDTIAPCFLSTHMVLYKNDLLHLVSEGHAPLQQFHLEVS
jgi:hypothetical protein